MRAVLLDAIATAGALSRAQALTLVADHVLDDAHQAGVISRMFPGVYTLPGLADDTAIRRQGALLYLPDAALSHLDGLDEWSLLPARHPAGAPIHLTRSAARPPVRHPGLRIHRVQTFSGAPWQVFSRKGLRFVSIERAIVDSYALLRPLERPVPAIVALRERRTTPALLRTALADTPRLPERAGLARLVSLAANGCHSPLELWGHENVFSDPRLPPSRQQVEIRVHGRTAYLDRYYEEEMVDVELDGAAYHGAPGQRERDLRRDAALSALGVLTVRFSHPRLHAEPDVCVEELLEILAMRRRQLRHGLAVAPHSH